MLNNLVRLGLFLFSGLLMAGELYDPLKINLADKEKIYQGAVFYLNYCSGCHSLKYTNLNELKRYLKKSPYVSKFVTLTDLQLSQPLQSKMSYKEAERWFGVIPPDLSLIAKKYSSLDLFNYLTGFYEDTTRPFNGNNWLRPNTAMPNVLSPLMGKKSLVLIHDSPQFVLKNKGSLTDEKLQQQLENLITFLVFISDPHQTSRFNLGYIVSGFFFICFLLLMALNRWPKK